MLSFLVDLAREGGELARRLRLEVLADSSSISCKSNLKDLVTAADRQVEAFIRSEIRGRYPAHGIYGEELGRLNPDNPYCWVIDPIDGTASYIHNQPFYCTSIGLQYRGCSQFGAVYCPVLQELYQAERGGGAFCNREPIRVLDHGRLADSQAGTGFSCLRAGWRENNNLPYFCALAQEMREIRRFGSAALDLCYVAAGKLDVFWELNLQEYDIAAGSLILSEAGGQISDLQGGDDWPRQGLLASNRVLHREILPFFNGYRRPD